jgi:Cd2+/Zn2+-exporting ATPase
LFNIYSNIFLKFSLFFILYLYVGYQIIIKSIKNLIKGKILDENFLMLIASIGAFCLSDFSEAIAVLLFYEIGELFQNYAVNKTRKSIAELMDTPDVICVERNGELEFVDPYEVEEGEIIVVKNGESVAIDGEIVFGDAYADAKALTGESIPYKVKPGDKILSGVIIKESSIKIKTITTFENSTINKISDMVQNITDKKSTSENFITKFAKYYTPIVVLLSFITFIVSLLLKVQFSKSLFRALTFLVI